MVARRRVRTTRKPRIQGAAQAATSAQQADIRAVAEADDLSRDVHSSRDQDYPSADPVHEDSDDWRPPSTLQAPQPRPGMVQRWVRAEFRDGRPDAKNVMRKRAEGWQSRRPETVKGGWSAPTINHGHLGSCIMVEGMVLMEMSARRNAQRNAYYAGNLDRQTEAIDAQLRAAQAPGHPIDRRTQTEVTVGRRPNVQEDDRAA